MTMWRDLTMQQRSDLMQATGIFDPVRLRQEYDAYHLAQGGHIGATGMNISPDWDPDNQYHYHTANGEKVVITPEDWEKHKGQPYFKQVEDAVLAEQAAHPGPEYIINPQFSQDLRMVYKGNMGPKYQNYSSFSGNLPQGYSFTSEGLVQDNQGNLYVQKGFRQTPRFTYDESNSLTFPVLEGRNQGNVTFYPVNMDKTVKPALPVSSVMDIDSEKNNMQKYTRKYKMFYPGRSFFMDSLEPFEKQYYKTFKEVPGGKSYSIISENLLNNISNAIKKDNRLYGTSNSPIPEGQWLYYKIENPSIEVGPLQVDDVQNYAKGGSIQIKPENRGKFTALKKRTGHSASWFKAHGTPAQRKMATFALNSKKWKHQEGGYLDDIPITKDGYLKYDVHKTPQVIIPSNSITMNNLPQKNKVPIIGEGIPSGRRQVMVPGSDYLFEGDYAVKETPIINQFGGMFKKKETPNYLYITYGLNGQNNATFTGSYSNPIFGYQPLSGIKQSIGRDYSMPDYNSAAIIETPIIMNPERGPRQMDLVDLKNRQLFAESRGNEKAKSPRGASGLYQIMPDTAQWYADSTGNVGSVWDPVYNEQIRDWLMDRLYNYDWAKSAKTDEERWRRAYAGYNWGSGNMSKAISKYGDDWLKHVPNETRDYVTFIIDNIDVGKHTTNEKYNKAKKTNKYFKQYGGLIKPFSYTDIPVVRYDNGGYSYI